MYDFCWPIPAFVGVITNKTNIPRRLQLTAVTAMQGASGLSKVMAGGLNSLILHCVKMQTDKVVDKYKESLDKKKEK
jgi:hypothetical protein